MTYNKLKRVDLIFHEDCECRQVLERTFSKIQ
jgi:hypothetical protein